MLLGDRPGGAAVSVVIGCNALRARNGTLQVRKPEQPLADGKVRAETGVLHERRAPRREVAHGAVAEPAAVRLDIDALRDGELRPGALDVVAELDRAGDGRARINHLPAVGLERVAVALVARVDVERDLESLRRAPG